MMISKHVKMQNLRNVLREDHWWLKQAFWRKVKSDDSLMALWKADIENGDGGLLHALEQFAIEMLGGTEALKYFMKAELLNRAEEQDQFLQEDAYWEQVSREEELNLQQEAAEAYSDLFY